MTTTTTHTSGPWCAEKLDASPDHSWAIDSELVEIARLLEWPDHQAEAEANARLIAAAPEMLEALVGLRDYLQTLAGEVQIPSSLYLQGKRAMDYAEVALAKAKGGEE